MSYTCRIYGLGLLSNEPIPGVPCSTIALVDVRLTLGTLPDWIKQNDLTAVEPWYTSEYKDESGNPALKLFEIQAGNYFHFSYLDGTEFVVDRGGTNIWATWPATATIEDTSTYLLGPVMGFVLQLRGSISLHASAIVVGNQAIAIAGPAGSGKSTTAAAFATRGYRVLAEDVVTLDDRGDSFLVLPAYPCIRLWPASVQALFGANATLPRLTPTWDKCFLDLNKEPYSFGTDPIPLAAIYFLAQRTEDPSAPYLTEISTSKALLSLIANTYTSHLMDRPMRAHGFGLLSRLQAAVPIKELTPHNDPDRIDELCATIVRDFELRNRTQPAERASEFLNV